MGNQQTSSREIRLIRARLDPELVDALIEGDLRLVKKHLVEDDDINLGCLAEYAIELNQGEIFQHIISRIPDEDELRDTLVLTAYEKDLIIGEDEDFIKEFFPLIENRQKLLNLICTKADLACFKHIENELTDEDIAYVVKESASEVRGEKIIRYIQRHQLMSPDEIREIQTSNSTPAQMQKYLGMANDYAPMFKNIMNAIGVKDSDGITDNVFSMMSKVSTAMGSGEKTNLPTLDKKIKTAIRKFQKNRIRHSLRAGLHPCEILDYAYKHKHKESYKMVAAYMSDEPNYHKYYELGLRRDWFDSEDEIYKPKYVEPGLMESLAPHLKLLTNMTKDMTHDEKAISKKCRTAIFKFQKNRIRHAIRNGEDITEMANCASLISSEVFDYIMSLWPEDKDVTPMLCSICHRKNELPRLLKYFHLAHRKLDVIRKIAMAYEMVSLIECLKLCSLEEIMIFANESAKSTNTMVIKHMQEANLIPDYHKFLRINKLDPSMIIDYSALISGISK